MHVLEAAFIANANNSQANDLQALAQTPLRPSRLLRRALAGFVLMGLAVALLDAAAPAESLTLVATTRAPVR